MTRRLTPAAFAAFYVANGQAHRDNAHFASFTTHLTAAQAGKLTLEPRFVGAQFLAHHCDAVVTHQWENALNYLYWEALHGGYPLIHNSPMLDGLGYRYPDFDAEAGAKAVLGAFASHDDNFAAYKATAAERIAELDPVSAASRAAHEPLMAELGL